MRKIISTSGVSLGLIVLIMGCSDTQAPLQFESSATEPAAKKGAKPVKWTVPGDFSTIADAIADAGVLSGHTIEVAAGSHAGALLTKGVHIKGTGGAVIDTGPMHPAGLSQGFRLLTGSDGASISHLTFTTDLSIMNGAAVDDVEVAHCTFQGTLQAVSNWGGSGWSIHHNAIEDLRTRCGGGIGVLIADYTGGVVSANEVSHNRISGQLNVADGDCGGYNGSGIVIFADFRWGRSGAAEMSGNLVTHNSVSLVSSSPGLVDVAAFELTDTRDDDDLIVLFDNAIGFNDFRGTTLQIALTPASLDQVNSISRNLGSNRGHGLHPSAFKPDN